MVVAEEGYESLDGDGEADVRHACSAHNSFVYCPSCPDEQLLGGCAPAAQRPRSWEALECGSRSLRSLLLVDFGMCLARRLGARACFASLFLRVDKY